MNSNFEHDFIIKFDFNKQSRKPAHVFRLMSEIIEAFTLLDKAVISTINLKIEPLIMLEDVEKGSILSKFKYLLENIPDEAIDNLEWKKLVGHFLKKAKYVIIDFINKRETIIATDELEILESELIKLTEQIQLGALNVPGIIDRPKLLTGISKISNAITQVEDNEKVFYKTDEDEAQLSLSFSFTEEQIEDLLTAETINSSAEMILKIKKPDYLGDSKWEFRHRREAINAKLSDTEWLAKFRNREIALKPGDSIRANVNIEVKYDYDREVAAINHTILKVIEVIYAKNHIQNNLFE